MSSKSLKYTALPQLLLEIVPNILWFSDPVRPDETVLLTGHSLDNAIIELVDLGDEASKSGAVDWEQATRVQPLQSDATNLQFVVPAAWEMGLYAARIRVGERASATFYLNTPQVWWLQGEAGLAAHPGGWLRVFGKCLHLGNTAIPRIRLTHNTGEVQVLDATESSCWALRFALPVEMKTGSYAVEVHNGFGGKGGWHEAGTVPVQARMPEKTVLLNVQDYGARPNTDTDCTLAIVAALEQLNALGGGVLYFPRGRYRIDGGLRSGLFLPHSIKIPSGVTLRGESMKLVSLYWPDREEPLPSLLEGGDDFAVEELSLYCQGRHRNVISGESRVRIHRVRIRANCYYMLDVPGQAHRGRNVTESHRQMGSAIELSGQGIQVTECDIYHSCVGINLKHVQGGLIARNTIRFGSNYAQLYGGRGVIFEENDCSGAHLAASGGGLSLFFGAQVTKNYYFAHNTLRDIYGGDREALTLDGHGTAYLGGITRVTGTQVTLSDAPTWNGNLRDGMRTWHDSTLYILDGQGAGQHRTLVGCVGRELTINRPFDVKPDASSTLAIGLFNGRHLIIGNSVYDAGSTVQLYPPNCECIVAQNRGYRAGNYNVGGTLAIDESGGGNRVEPSWFNQLLDNHIVEGNGWGGSGGTSTVNGMVGGESRVSIYGAHAGPRCDFAINRWQVVRGQVCHNNASLSVCGSVSDVVIENSAIHHNETGVTVRSNVQHEQANSTQQAVSTPRRITLRNQSFCDVATSLSGDAIHQVMIVS